MSATATIVRAASEYADSLPELSSSVSTPFDVDAGDWWVVHTKARAEKAVAAQLERRKVEHFLPLACVQRRYGARRATEVSLPLFPGYLFLCGGDTERLITLDTHRVARVIRVINQEGLKRELDQIYRTVTSGITVDLYPGIKRGRRCRVVAGSLKGIEGVVLRRRGVCRVFLAVEILGQSAEVELDPGLLEVIE